jgi:transposase
VPLTEAQYRRIHHCFPTVRGNVSINNLTVLNAVLHVVETNCSWRQLPKHFGSWHTVYTRVSRWSRNGVLDRVFAQLQAAHILRIHIEVSAVDTTFTLVQGDHAGGSLRRSGDSPTLTTRESFISGSVRIVWLPRPLDGQRSAKASP